MSQGYAIPTLLALFGVSMLSEKCFCPLNMISKKISDTWWLEIPSFQDKTIKNSKNMRENKSLRVALEFGLIKLSLYIYSDRNLLLGLNDAQILGDTLNHPSTKAFD
ncbi:hypothetical protein ACJX0J_028645 [Zea mays]